LKEREKDRERERKGKRPLKLDTFLSAPDVLARHLLVRRDSAVPGTPSGQGTRPRGYACMHAVKITHRKCPFSRIVLLDLGSFSPTLEGLGLEGVSSSVGL